MESSLWQCRNYSGSDNPTVEVENPLQKWRVGLGSGEPTLAVESTLMQLRICFLQGRNHSGCGDSFRAVETPRWQSSSCCGDLQSYFWHSKTCSGSGEHILAVKSLVWQWQSHSGSEEGVLAVESLLKAQQHPHGCCWFIWYCCRYPIWLQSCCCSFSPAPLLN